MAHHIIMTAVTTFDMDWFYALEMGRVGKKNLSQGG